MFCIKQFCFLTEKKRSDFTRRYLNTQDTTVRSACIKNTGILSKMISEEK